jgi:hypothetical protein
MNKKEKQEPSELIKKAIKLSSEMVIEKSELKVKK